MLADDVEDGHARTTRLEDEMNRRKTNQGPAESWIGMRDELSPLFERSPNMIPSGLENARMLKNILFAIAVCVGEVNQLLMFDVPSPSIIVREAPAGPILNLFVLF